MKMTGVWDAVDQNAATYKKICRLRSALRERADLEVLAVVTVGDLPALTDRAAVARAMIEVTSSSTVSPPAQRRGRVSELDSSLDLFPSEKVDSP